MVPVPNRPASPCQCLSPPKGGTFLLVCFFVSQMVAHVAFLMYVYIYIYIYIFFFLYIYINRVQKLGPMNIFFNVFFAHHGCIIYASYITLHIILFFMYFFNGKINLFSFLSLCLSLSLSLSKITIAHMH